MENVEIKTKVEGFGLFMKVSRVVIQKNCGYDEGYWDWIYLIDLIIKIVYQGREMLKRKRCATIEKLSPFDCWESNGKWMIR